MRSEHVNEKRDRSYCGFSNLKLFVDPWRNKAKGKMFDLQFSAEQLIQKGLSRQ